MRVVTTCHKAGFEQYGHRLLEGWKHWPKEAELWFYTEGFDIPETTGVKQVKIEQLQGLDRFKAKYANYQPPNYLFDVVRFSHKVYAACDALAGYKGVGVWLDGDCVTYQDIPSGYIEGLIPRGAYIALFQRKGMYTETGFWAMDGNHPQHDAFLSTWADWYDTDAFKTLANWTDCETLDATVRRFERAGLIKAHNLSGEFAGEMHPMAKVDLARYIDHCKGPLRKAKGVSKENKFRVPAEFVGRPNGLSYERKRPEDGVAA